MKTLTCRKCGADEERSVHILYECLALKKGRTVVVGRTQTNPGQLNEKTLSGMVLGKRAGMLDSPLQIQTLKNGAMSPTDLSPWNPSKVPSPTYKKKTN